MAKILLIEDDAPLRQALEEFLGQLGHGVEAVEAAPEACSILEESPVDLVITDIHLPGNGFSVLDHARSLQPEAPVIMLTGRPEAGGAARARRKGAFRYLTKPVSGTELIDVVRCALETRDAYGEELEAEE